MKNIILILITVIFTVSGCIMQEPEKFDETKHPEPCFQNGGSFAECADYSAPIPSDYMTAVLPAGIPISLKFPTSYPLNIRLSSAIDSTTAKEGIHILKAGQGVYEVVDNTKYSILYGELDTATFEFSTDETFLNIFPLNDDGTFGEWEQGYTYLVVLTKELRDINNLTYAKPAAFFMAASTFEITPGIVKALDPSMSDAEAEATVLVLLAMRDGLNQPFQLIEMLLEKTKFDVTFLWSFEFSAKTVCFQSEDIKNCENDIIPMPSDFMTMALPPNTHLNTSKASPFTINFSDDIDLDSFTNNLVIVQTPILTETAPIVMNNEDLIVTLDENNSKRVIITHKTGVWDNNFTYIVYLKKGVKTNANLNILPSFAFFLGTLENSLLDADGNSGDLLVDLGFAKDSASDTATAQGLEGLRLMNQPLIALAEALTVATRDDLLMIWTVTIEGIIPCFNSADFSGCENANTAPLPSDFIMKYEADGSHHLDLPIADDDPDMLKGMLTALNSLDGWSTVKPFNITLSDNIDPTTLTPQNLLVLKMNADGSATPVGVIPSFREDWKQLDIAPLMRTWDEASTYIVVLTSDIKGKSGENFVKPIGFSFMAEEESLLNEDGSSKYSSALDDATANFLEGGRLQFKPALDALATMGYPRDKVSMLWTVTTQSITNEIKGMRQFVLGNPLFTTSMTLDPTKTIPAVAFGSAFPPEIPLTTVSLIAFGTFKVPMLLSDPTSPYMGAFDPNNFPADATTPPVNNATVIDVPFMVAFPTPADENVVADTKLIVFQHGFMRAKEDVLAIVDTFTSQGYIVVSYDMPLHGERTVEGGSTGDGFISLNVFATRDNIRQAVLEQVKMIDTLKGIDFIALDSTGLVQYSTIDPDNIFYIGHSMGTFVGNILVTIEDSIKKGVLNVAGAHFTKMLMHTTEDIKAPIVDGLAALGIAEGTPAFDQFLYLAQVGVEKADSINYKPSTDNTLIQEALNDPVIVNEVTRDFGISQGYVNPMDNTIIKTDNYKYYDTGATFEDIHSFILLPTAATAAARTDVMTFFATPLAE